MNELFEASKKNMAVIHSKPEYSAQKFGGAPFNSSRFIRFLEKINIDSINPSVLKQISTVILVPWSSQVNAYTCFFSTATMTFGQTFETTHTGLIVFVYFVHACQVLLLVIQKIVPLILC